VTEEIYTELSALEAEHRLDTLRAPDQGLARAIHAWASDATLEVVLGDGMLLPGDFVRWCKQVVDLLGQIAAVPGHLVAHTARDAARQLDRGVVAYA
jgi:ATP-dependent RNA helicase HelY